jgi:hypothetical protein
MPFIPRQVKPPVRMAITCKVPEEIAALLKHYAEFLESSQEYIVAETLRLAFRRDQEFHRWLAATHPETRTAAREPRTGRSVRTDHCETHDSSAAGDRVVKGSQR